jgi:hypothetical protein
MNKQLKRICLPAFTIAPGLAQAGEGPTGLSSAFGLWILGALVVGLAINVAIVLLLRRMRNKWAVTGTVLVLCSPLLLAAGRSLWFNAAGEKGDVIEEIARTPVIVRGAIFPAGSEIDYEQTGFGRWSRKAISARSNVPVKFGALEILDLQNDTHQENGVSVTLARDQKIAPYWSCARGQSTTHLDSASPEPQLAGCTLAASATLGDLRWPAGSTVSKQANDWILKWQNPMPGTIGAVEAFGFPIENMQARYSPARDLKAWHGFVLEPPGDLRRLGAYSLSSDGERKLTWSPASALRVYAKATDLKTGSKYECLVKRGASVSPCTEDEMNHPVELDAGF